MLWLSRDTDFSNYDCILLVGKSIGTIVAAEIGTCSNFPQNIHYVLYTPLEETFTFPFSDAIAFTGSADPWVMNCSIADLCQQRGIPCHVIQNANHSLETGDVDNDIDNLKFIMKKTGKYNTGWYRSSGKTYYFDSNGYKLTGWQTLNKKRYYFSVKDGHMLTGLQKIGTKYYYLSPQDGHMMTGHRGKEILFQRQGRPHADRTTVDRRQNLYLYQRRCVGKIGLAVQKGAGGQKSLLCSI